MRRTLIALVAGAALTGCTMSVKDPQEVISGTKSGYDQYSGVQVLNGPQMDLGSFPNITQIWLSAGISAKPSGNYIKMSVWHWSQTGWKFLSSASDSDAVPLVLHQLDRNVERGGNVEERVSIDLSEKYLEAHTSTGLNIRLLGQKGSIIAELQPAYVQGFLERYRSEKARLGLSDQPVQATAPASPASSVATALPSATAAPAAAPTMGGASPVFGVRLMAMPASLAPMMQAQGFGGVGVAVISVFPDTPAAKAGLVPGDMILEFQGKSVAGPKEFGELVAAAKPGTKVGVKVRRMTGAIIQLEAQL